MQTISPESFAMICFLALMQNGTGIVSKAPSYIEEKIDILNSGYDAFAYLDIHNMGVVMNWCRIWKIKVPNIVEAEYSMQEKALEELKGLAL